MKFFIGIVGRQSKFIFVRILKTLHDKEQLVAALIHMKYNMLFPNKSQQLTSHILPRFVYNSSFFFHSKFAEASCSYLVSKGERSLIWYKTMKLCDSSPEIYSLPTTTEELGLFLFQYIKVINVKSMKSKSTETWFLLILSRRLRTQTQIKFALVSENTRKLECYANIVFDLS